MFKFHDLQNLPMLCFVCFFDRMNFEMRNYVILAEKYHPHLSLCARWHKFRQTKLYPPNKSSICQTGFEKSSSAYQNRRSFSISIPTVSRWQRSCCPLLLMCCVKGGHRGNGIREARRSLNGGRHCLGLCGLEYNSRRLHILLWFFYYHRDLLLY